MEPLRVITKNTKRVTQLHLDRAEYNHIWLNEISNKDSAERTLYFPYALFHIGDFHIENNIVNQSVYRMEKCLDLNNYEIL